MSCGRQCALGPCWRVLPPGQNLSYTTLTEPFLMYFRVALFAGIIAALPGAAAAQFAGQRKLVEQRGKTDADDHLVRLRGLHAAPRCARPPGDDRLAVSRQTGTGAIEQQPGDAVAVMGQFD